MHVAAASVIPLSDAAPATGPQIGNFTIDLHNGLAHPYEMPDGRTVYIMCDDDDIPRVLEPAVTYIGRDGCLYRYDA